ncbi:unnamed protein product, partial [Mesorhabditis belari]|uniref:MAM domain-containing protein n=1 Tax=Mesorhabditis belari TaxID=2138241 RepID=A0AAF3FIE0_9BILA
MSGNVGFQYLDLYLGIRPENQGEILKKTPPEFAEYVKEDRQLDCDFQRECLWKNADSDGLLDTSEFWLFKKNDEKVFPVQVQPGNANLQIGTRFMIAGNTTKLAQSAVLLSAPLACHHGMANITFNYWLYNLGRVEVMAVRPEPRRGHLMVIERGKADCHFLKESGHVCSALIPAVKQPYRLAIRAFNLRDNTVGSMVLINNITVKADLCNESPFPLLFNSVPLKPRPRAHPSALKDASRSTTKPTKSFLFMAVDPLTPKPYGTLRSQLIPCTSKLATLSFRYWLRAGTQVEVCSVDENDVPLSCAYLSEEDSPGPIQIDIEPYMKPFRFTIDLIAFDANSMGLVVVDELKFIGGQLCIEHPPPIPTTIDPPTVAHMFGLQPKPLLGANEYRLSLECDFTIDHCNQWVNDDGKLQYGAVPQTLEDFPLPKQINGNVAVLMLKGKDASSIRSREVPCAYNSLITIHYMRSQFGFLRVCALGQCMEGKKLNGTLQVQISSEKPFEIIIEASSKKNAIIVISSIEVEGDICPLRTVEQILCDRIKCDFKEHTCNYESTMETGDRELLIGTNGGVCTIAGHDAKRCVLRSSYFDLPAPATLIIDVTQFTFGSRVLLCADADADSDNCHELLGPRVLTASPRKVEFPLDESVHQFSLVFFHDKADQFGAARFEISSIDIRAGDGYKFCF